MGWKYLCVQCDVKHDRDNREWPCLKDLQAESDHKKMFSVGEQYVNHLEPQWHAHIRQGLSQPMCSRRGYIT